MSVSFLEVLDRAHSGPVCEQANWDKRVIPRAVKEKLKEHGLNRLCTPENPINTDDKLADEFWRAGFELAVEVGMLCLDTDRIVKFTERELRMILRHLPPSELALGEQKERIVIRSRKPEDKKTPIYRMGFGKVSEDLFIPLVQGIVKNRIVDLAHVPDLETMYGRPIRSGTPYETLAGIFEASLTKEAVRRAGRLGMPLSGVGVSPTAFGELGGYGKPQGYMPPNDVGVILTPSELKTSYHALHKVANDVINSGGNAIAGHYSLIGGYAGPPEGCAIAAVAAFILQIAVHRTSITTGNIYDPRYMGNIGRDAVWAQSLAYQAQSRNTDALVGGLCSQVSGPCTPEDLYEVSVKAIEHCVSGCALTVGSRSAGGGHMNHQSPLEQWHMAEVLKACAGMRRSDANEIVKALIPKYEDKMKHPNIGKTFTECFDLKTLTPTKEWMDIYDNVQKELIDLGVPLDK